MRVIKLIPLAVLSGGVTAQITPSFSWMGLGGGGSPSCGDRLTISTKLTENLVCDCRHGPALTIAGRHNVLDLNDHYVSCGNDTTAEFDPMMGVGIKLEGKQNCVIGPGNVTESNVGILLAGDGEHTLERVSIYDVGLDGIHISSDINLVDQCIVELSGDTGVYIEEEPKYNTVRDSVITDVNGAGIDIHGSLNLIEGNQVSESANYLLIIGSFGNRIFSNTFQNSNDDAIWVREAPGAHTIRGNEISNAYKGIEVDDDANQIHIENNHIFDCDNRGIFLDKNNADYPKNMIIRDNIFTNVDDAIVAEGCDDCMFLNNIMNAGKDRGFKLESGNDNVISGNIITNNPGIGFDVTATDTFVTRNSIDGNSPDLDDTGTGTTWMSDNVPNSLGASDERLKTDIHHVGHSPSGIPLYTFKYKKGVELAGKEELDTESTFLGTMAQDLLDIAPEAVLKNPIDGYYRVDYSKIDVDFLKVHNAM